MNHTSKHYRFDLSTAAKINKDKLIHPHFLSLPPEHIIKLFTDDADNKKYYPQNTQLSFLNIQQLIAQYHTAQHPQTWVTQGSEKILLDEDLHLAGKSFSEIFPGRLHQNSKPPQSSLLQIGTGFKGFHPHKNLKNEIKSCWSFGVKDLHPDKYLLKQILLPRTHIRHGFNKINQWAYELLSKKPDTVTMISPCSHLHNIAVDIQVPDLEFGWAPSTTFLNWIETTGLLIDWTDPNAIGGYICISK